jgi:hypothetical protein
VQHCYFCLIWHLTACQTSANVYILKYAQLLSVARLGMPAWVCLGHGVVAPQVDPRGKTWNRLRASIGQPNFIDVGPEDKVGDGKLEGQEVPQKVPQMS